MRVDPLVWLTLAGLAGVGLLGALHPVESLDLDDPTAQAGRHVRAALVVTDVQAQPAWWRGTGIPLDPSGATGRPLDWVWFRPPTERALPGDRIAGTALVERDGARASLLLDGPQGAAVTPGPHPVAIAWADLLDGPGGLAGRLLVINGRVTGGAVEAPDGSATCPLVGDAPSQVTASRWLVRLEPDPHAPAWRCRVEGPAP